jgi:hypothetical protein
MTIDSAKGLRDQALQLAFEKEVARQRLRSALSLAKDFGIAVLILAGIGTFLSIASSGLNLFSLR